MNRVGPVAPGPGQCPPEQGGQPNSVQTSLGQTTSTQSSGMQPVPTKTCPAAQVVAPPLWGRQLPFAHVSPAGQATPEQIPCTQLPPTSMKPEGHGPLGWQAPLAAQLVPLGQVRP